MVVFHIDQRGREGAFSLELWDSPRSNEVSVSKISRTAFAARLPYMNALKKLFKRLRANPRVPVAVLSLMLVVVGFVLLAQEATRETNARKSPEMLPFEKAPEAWLQNQRNVSELLKSADVMFDFDWDQHMVFHRWADRHDLSIFRPVPGS